MDIPFLRKHGYTVLAVEAYTESATRKGQGWLTLTNGLDNITLTDVTPRELDMLGRAIRYAAAKLETLAMTKQRRIEPTQEQIEAKDDFEMAEYGDPVG